MSDGIHDVADSYAPVKDGAGADIINGTYTVLKRTENLVGFIRRDTAPSDSEPSEAHFTRNIDNFKYILSPTEKLYARTSTGVSQIGVILG